MRLLLEASISFQILIARQTRHTHTRARHLVKLQPEFNKIHDMRKQLTDKVKRMTTEIFQGAEILPVTTIINARYVPFCP
jgi:hypothetical protein